MKIPTLAVTVMAIAFAVFFVSGVLYASDMLSTSFSPDGRTSAVWTKNHEILVVDSSGAVLQKIGVHGAAPLFSHDGNFVAYEKLADIAEDDADQSLFEFAQGIAVYDIRTGQDRLVTDGGGDDFAPVGFSRDLSLLYFNSTRPYDDSPGNHVASLWVVNLKTGEFQRLTNHDEAAVRSGNMVPTINPKALWSSDRTVVITSNGSEQGIWKFVLTGNGVSAARIADGDSPQWVIPDESFAIHTIDNGKSIWRTLKVR